MKSEDHYRALLKPLYPSVELWVRGGFNFYFDNYRAYAFQHTPRTRATIINDHIVDLASRGLAAHGVRLLRVEQRALFDFKGECLLHFKMLDSKKRPQNYPTFFALGFSKQQDLPGLPARLPRLTIGYIPKRDWSGIESVYITCADGDHVEWFIDVSAENLTTTIQPNPIQSKATENVESRRTKKERIKRDGDSERRAAE